MIDLALPLRHLLCRSVAMCALVSAGRAYAAHIRAGTDHTPEGQTAQQAFDRACAEYQASRKPPQ